MFIWNFFKRNLNEQQNESIFLAKRKQNVQYMILRLVTLTAISKTGITTLTSQNQLKFEIEKVFCCWKDNIDSLQQSSCSKTHMKSYSKFKQIITFSIFILTKIPQMINSPIIVQFYILRCQFYSTSPVYQHIRRVCSSKLNFVTALERDHETPFFSFSK